MNYNGSLINAKTEVMMEQVKLINLKLFDKISEEEYQAFINIEKLQEKALCSENANEIKIIIGEIQNEAKIFYIIHESDKNSALSNEKFEIISDLLKKINEISATIMKHYGNVEVRDALNNYYREFFSKNSSETDYQKILTDEISSLKLKIANKRIIDSTDNLANLEYGLRLVEFELLDKFSINNKSQKSIVGFNWSGTETQLLNLYGVLKGIYIDSLTEFEDFKKVFTYQTIDNLTKVIWIKSKPDLLKLFELLNGKFINYNNEYFKLQKLFWYKSKGCLFKGLKQANQDMLARKKDYKTTLELSSLIKSP